MDSLLRGQPPAATPQMTQRLQRVPIRPGQGLRWGLTVALCAFVQERGLATTPPPCQPSLFTYGGTPKSGHPILEDCPPHRSRGGQDIREWT